MENGRRLWSQPRGFRVLTKNATPDWSRPERRNERQGFEENRPMANKHHTMNEPQTTTLTTDDIRPWDWDSEFGAELNREVRKRLIGCRAIADWLREHGDDMAPFQCDDAERRQLSARLERHTAAQD